MTSMRGMNRWEGKTAVVTGAGSGVGAGVAAALAAAGMRVVALDSKEEEAITEALNELKHTDTSDVTARQCDVSDLNQLGETFRWLDEHHGGVHVLVSLTGVVEPSQITGFVFENSGSQGTDVDTNATLMCARHALVCMKKNDINGHIINVTSTAAGCTEALNQELARFKNKIKVTGISPGSVSSSSPVDDAVTDSDRRPVLEPADIAHAVVFALSTPPHVNVQELNIGTVTERGL